MPNKRKRLGRRLAKEHNIPFGVSYFTLSSTQISALESIGKAIGYRYTGRAGKGYTRGFYDYLQKPSDYK